MRSHPMLVTLLLVGACGGGTYYTTLTAAPSTSPPDVIACARAKLTRRDTSRRLSIRSTTG